ncbi:MAG: hypothetical protein JWN46_1453 [Acidimicrobiales bacterium]|nr:hypothetical protein [Acidimicrobiales bacterium]
MLAAAGTAAIGIGNPNTSGAFPFCPLRAVTGIDCPFCGCLRATHALVHGHVGTALNHNLLFTVAAPFLVVGWLLWMGRSLGLAWPRVRAPRWAPWAFVAVALAFMVLRNLSGTPFHWLDSAA